MPFEDKVKELSDIERKVILSLSNKQIDFSTLSITCALPLDSVRRAAAWLSQKELAIVEENETEK